MGQNDGSPVPKSMKILVAGGSGFIGRKLISKLTDSRKNTGYSTNDQIICMTRNPESVRGFFSDQVRLVQCDVTSYDDLRSIMTKHGTIDVAYYLVHSMEGNSKNWKRFSERDRKAASNFAKAAAEFGVKRIIYLGGLSHGQEKDLSEHMKSRNEVGEILKSASEKTTIFKAAVILGQGGGSFQMLQYLVERLPLMICPKWVLTKSQPISVDDVVTYLVKALEVKETVGRTFEIGGPDVLTYVDMMTRYAAMLNKKVRILIIPFLTPRLSSYWVDLVTPVKASLARPLIDSLKHEATVHDDSANKVIPIKLKSFEEAISAASSESVVRRSIIPFKERTSKSINTKVLVVALIALVAIGSMYYLLETKGDAFVPGNLALLSFWYLGIAFALYFIRQGARLGAFVAGIVGWATLAFWLLEGTVLFRPNIPTEVAVDPVALWLELLGISTVCVEITASHNVFHKLSVFGR